LLNIDKITLLKHDQELRTIYILIGLCAGSYSKEAWVTCHDSKGSQANIALVADFEQNLAHFSREKHIWAFVEGNI
jgi:hypothetical protein